MRLAAIAAVVALLAVSAGAAHAQFFNAVYSRDGRDVIAVGDSGQVYRSLTGGATWLRSDVGNKPLRDVAARGFTIVMVGDSGKIWRSTNSGGSWALTVLAGAPQLRALEWPDAATLFVAGANGTIYRSVDAGASWQPLSSGTSQTLRALKFRDALNGWAVGNAGVARATTDGGANWNTVAVPTTRNLLGVDFLGSLVWVVGERAMALKSTTGGASWTQQNLKLDSGSPVVRVHLASPDTVFLAGGGGFLRRSADGGATWTFLEHKLQGTFTDLFMGGGGGWMTASNTRLIPFTSNGGATWSVPTGTVHRRNWNLQIAQTGTIRGATLTLNPLDQKTLYMFMGATLYRSRNDGDTWTAVGTVPSASKANAFAISPKDTNLMLAAVGAPDRVVRSDDGGLTWNDQITMNFGEYGVPMEVHPDKPDTVYFGPDGAPLQRSLDFGKTWSSHGSFSFISPCDIAVLPDNDSTVILVGDGITSSGVAKIHRSNNGGQTFVPVFAPPTGASEVPTISTSRLRNTDVFASAWSSGAFKRSTDGGLSWNNVLVTSQTWGNDVAKDDPTCVVMGTYGNQTYVSTDGGTNYQLITLAGSNYSLFARDRGFILAEQGTGVFRLAFNDTFTVQMGQTVTLNAPNGGEDWVAGSVHPITWNAGNVVQARIEYRRSAGDPWQLVALVDGVHGTYDWTVPNDSTASAQIRVSDAWDGSPSDLSNATFRIRLPRLAAEPVTHDFGAVTLNTTAGPHTLTLSNPGDAEVTVTSIASSNPKFWTGRTTMTIAAGGSDTTGVYYHPDAAVEDTATVTANSATGSAVVTLYGHGQSPVGVEDGQTPLAFALHPNRPNPFTGRTLIRYALPRRSAVTVDVFDVQGHRVARLVDGEQAPGNYSVAFGNGVTGQRLRSGVYFVRMEAPGFRSSRKVLMLQ